MNDRTTNSRTDTVRFVLDGRVVELRDIDPARTVLQYLREDLHRTGSKEGCAEGDCGACTVVVAEAMPNGRLRARAINACIQFLPTLDGKELLTVESLKQNGELHPVQSAMLDCHGSQCGFCTPGFVMSLFALYKNQPHPERTDIDDALAGNLCRCTGYRPIVEAAREMYRRAPGDGSNWLLAPCGAEVASDDEKRRVALLQSIRHGKTVTLQKSGRRYFAPRTAAELAALCREHPDATLLAGGTDVGLWVTKQHRDLRTIIYTGAVAELHDLRTDDNKLHIGAAVTFTDAMPTLLQHLPAARELMLRFASPPIRNAGTLGGNVANGSPIGDSMPLLLAADATVDLRNADGVRSMPLADFYLDYMQNALRDDEFVEKVSVPLPAADDLLAAYKISKRFDQDISAVCGAFRVRLDDDGRVREARLAYGGMAAIPKRAGNAEAALAGQPFTEATIDAAMRALSDDFTPLSDMRASDEYRARVAQNLLLRFYREQTAARAGNPPNRIYDYGRHAQA